MGIAVENPKRPKVAAMSPRSRIETFAHPRLEDADVFSILHRRYVMGETLLSIAKRHGISEAAVSRICSGKAWGYALERFKARKQRRWENG